MAVLDYIPELFVWPVVAFLAVLVLVPLARKLALAIGFVDKPGGRKTHEGTVPLVGGLVVFAVFIVVSLLSGGHGPTLWPLYAGLLMILGVGALDDYFDINPWVKFNTQFLATFVVVILGRAEISGLGNLFGFGPVELGIFAIPFSVFCTVLLINAINLMDGVDGLAGGKSFVILLWLVLACLLAGQYGAVEIIVPLMGALLGFLYYNMRHPLRDKAIIFLGDAGSMALGLFIAWFAIGLTKEPDPALVPISVAWIIALPVIDACGQFFRRIREGRHPFSPDRGHFHHHFLTAGMSPGRATLTILAIGFALGGVGYGGVLLGVPVPVLAYGWMLMLFVHVYLSLKPNLYIDCIRRFTK